jgi:ATP-dependent RNA helicase SUPV3L1/SUV3
MVRRIAELCGDPVEEVTLVRKGPLVAARAPVRLAELVAGDALIAFSRRDVLDYRAELVARGRRVAVVYGALSPEVRRAEAARFNSGDADILVATDAIGMGLNLNIRRIVFAELRKFDGEQRRELTSQEVKQIGGRAGRYGKHETGVVAVLAGGGSPETVARLLAAPPDLPEDLRPLVQPDADIVQAVAQEIAPTACSACSRASRRPCCGATTRTTAWPDLSQPLAVASEVDGIPGLTLAEKWTYALCPVDVRDNGVARLSRWAIEHGAGRPIAPPMAGRLPAPDRAGQEDLEKAEKVHRRLVAWRWMAQRFPQAYAEAEAAEGETARLNRWIEDVLRTQRRGRAFEPGRRHPPRTRAAEAHGGDAPAARLRH